MAKLLKQKKGVAYKFLFYILKLGLVVVIFAFIIYISVYFNATSVRSPEGRAVIFINRLLYSPTGLAYVDPLTQRAYPGIIDLDKFNATKLEQAIHFEKKSLIGANLTLSIFQENSPSISKSVAYNKKDFESWWPLRRFKEYTPITHQYYVLIYNKGQISRGTLIIKLVTQSV